MMRSFVAQEMHCNLAPTAAPTRSVVRPTKAPRVSTHWTAGKSLAAFGNRRVQQFDRQRKRFSCSANSAQADEQQLTSSQRSGSWNSKIGAVYQDLLPGPLLFLPSLLQPASTLISLEGAEHGHEWVHWLLSLLPVTQVSCAVGTNMPCHAATSCARVRVSLLVEFALSQQRMAGTGGHAIPCPERCGGVVPTASEFSEWRSGHSSLFVWYLLFLCAHASYGCCAGH